MATWDDNMDRHTISADLGFSASDLSDPSTDITLTSLSEDYKSQETQFKNTITTLGGYHTCLIKRTLLAADKPKSCEVTSVLGYVAHPVNVCCR